MSPVPPLSSAPAVELRRIVRAPRAAVYAAWTTPEILKSWWGPKGNVGTQAELDVREGGELTIADLSPADAPRLPGIPREVIGRGVYTEVVPLERLQFTLSLNWGRGEPSLITVTFRDVEGGTELTVRQENLPSDLSWAFEAGWNSTLDRLGELLVA